MRAKYFTADTQEAAEALACQYFGCDKSELLFDVINGKDEVPAEGDYEGVAGEQWFIAAIHGAIGDKSNLNAQYALFYEPGGVYLEVFRNRGHGEEIDSNKIIDHLKRKCIQNLNVPAAQSVIEKHYGRELIAPSQKEYIYGEDLVVIIAADEKEAVARLLEPEQGGALLNADGIKNKLKEQGVIHGINDDIINSMLTERLYNEPYVVARATLPIDGDDGKLIFHFSTEERTGRPREIDASGRVDFRSLDLYIPVTEGQLLVTRTPATEGEPGTTVRGNTVKQKPGKEAVLPRGKNLIINDERTEIKAACAGMVEFVNNALNVSNVYTVNGDCDISVGNIDFEGSVHISGSVRSGSSVKATDGISVGGSVEASTLIAGGNVEVKGGMLGADKGNIEAGGTVSIMFVERGKVSCDGPIKVDVAIHSTLETGDSIYALGKRGAIIGGSANAAGDIIANFIGALSNTKTNVRVGFMPRKRARLEHLEQNAAKLKTDKIKLQQLDAYLEKTKETLDKATWEKLYLSGIENKKINEETAAAEAAEMTRLHDEMERATDNRVHVFETAFGGSRITIGASSLNVTNDIGFATFRFSDGEIVYGPCEKSKTDFSKG